MASFNLDQILHIALMVGIVMLSTVLHEVAHAATANALGDPTAKEQGRLTLNPFKHLDLVGSFVLPLLMALVGGPIFAFAKPVPYNPNRLKNPVRDEVLVALAGPACNFLQACIGAVAFRAMVSSIGFTGLSEAAVWGLDALATYVYLNLMLMFFNLIPLPPLDGSSIVSPLLRGKARDWYYVVQRNAMPVLLAVMYLVPMVFHIDPVGMYLDATAQPLAVALLGY
ncbi:MAG: site-2 protease family protein [Atopobiaceae bacterium]|nr:site-2 protease family protein [Atopobiaceae bacterium]MBR3313598.1 site-2 protease family protein [Atopobiaceae bacterium]